MARKLLALCLAFIIYLPMKAGEPSSSLSVVSSFVAVALDSAMQTLATDKRITLDVSNHPDADWIESMALKSASARGLEVGTGNASAHMNIVVNDLSTRYVAVESADSIQRIITSSISFIISRNGERTVLNLGSASDTVTCLRRDALAAESEQHSSTQGEMPAEERTFWDEALEPAIFVVAAIATVVLLFTVRSQ